MAIIQFEDGTKVDFQGNPTQQDVEEVAAKLGLKGNQPKSQPSNKSYNLLGDTLGYDTKRDARFAPSLLQNTIGSRGIAGVGQLPGKTLGAFEGIKESTDLYNSSADVANKAADLLRLARTQTDPALKKKYHDLGMQLLDTSKETLASGDKLREETDYTAKQALGTTANAATTVASAGGAAKSAVGRILQGVATGAGYGFGSSAADNKENKDITKDTIVGGVVGGATAGLVEGVKYAVKGVPKLLSYTSDTPEAVLNRNYDNPDAMALATKELKQKGGQETLNHVRGAVRGLRTDLSKQYEEGASELATRNTGKRIGFTEGSKEFKLLQKVADDFSIDLPDNASSFGVDEYLSLNKEINELLRKPAIKITPQGVGVRKLKEVLASKAKQFDGVDEFLSNYATEKQVFDAADSIVKAFNKNPVTASTAQSRLRLAFGDNKTAYYSALKDLEEKTGVPILDKVAALATGQKLPKAGHSLINQLVEILAFAVTSPRSAAALSRGAGRLSNSPANNAIRSGVTKVTTDLINRNR